MRYEFHPAALEEYRQAALWYAAREQQVALSFKNSLALVQGLSVRSGANLYDWYLISERTS